MIDAVFPHGAMTALAYAYYIGIPLAALWCVLSFFKTYPRPGYLRVSLFDNLTRDSRAYFAKCRRLRKDGPTPCYCCKGKCYGKAD